MSVKGDLNCEIMNDIDVQNLSALISSVKYHESVPFNVNRSQIGVVNISNLKIAIYLQQDTSISGDKKLFNVKSIYDSGFKYKIKAFL